MFGLHYIKTGLIDKELAKYYSILFDKRISGDYEDFIVYQEKDILPLLVPAKKLIYAINNLIEDTLLI